MALVSGVKRVAQVGHAEPLSDVQLIVSKLHGVAIYDNTSVVFVGGPQTHGGQRMGLPLNASSTNKTGSFFDFDNVDLAEVFIDALVINEGVSYVYET